MYFALADIPHKAIENPIGFMSTAYRKPNQIIHPYMFSDGESDTENYTKKTTCLWTANLPLLVPKCTDEPDLGKLYGKYSNGKNTKQNLPRHRESIRGAVGRLHFTGGRMKCR
jgi:hypothetical protein